MTELETHSATFNSAMEDLIGCMVKTANEGEGPGILAAVRTLEVALITMLSVVMDLRHTLGGE